MKKLVIPVLVLSLCASTANAADLEKGKSSYATRCASCHGMEGAGDGVVGKSLPPGTVTNLVKGPFKFAVSEEKTKELIQKGGAALGLNPMMPPAPSIDPTELTNLAAFVMSLRK